MKLIAKIEPLTSNEMFFCGFTLQLFIMFFNIPPWIWTTDCYHELTQTNVETHSQLLSYHNCIKSNRSSILFGASLLFLTYPLIVSHCYYWQRIHNTIYSFFNPNVFKWFYFSSWYIGGTISCTIIPALSIFISYYDWEMDSSYIYIGYTLQFEFSRFLLILWKSVALAFVLTSVIPWIDLVFILFGCKICSSKYYHFDPTSVEYGLRQCICCKMGCQCKRCDKYTLAGVLFVILSLCVLLAIGVLFDLENEGLFSYDGNVHWLSVVFVIMWEMIAVRLMIGSFRFYQLKQFFEDRIVVVT